MSAGICIMNRNAIAMAADSAVTVGDHAAIHNSANKLFSLSKIAPVGLIIYANALLMSVPVEIIVKQYKKQLGDGTFTKLQDYVDDFVSYLERNVSFFRFDINERDYVLGMFIDLLNGLRGDFLNLVREATGNDPTKTLSKDEIEQISKTAYDTTIDFINQHTRRSDYFFGEYVRTQYSKSFIEIVKNRPDLKWLSKEQIEGVCDKACDLYDTDFDRNGYVGIAIAGYGEDEIYPHMVHMHVSGVINGKLRYWVQETVDISESPTASIVPLAQTDVMQTFLFGINDMFLTDLASEIPMQIKNTIISLDESLVADDKKETVNAQFNTVTDRIIKHMSDVARKAYMNPIIQSVSTLPIEELALLAESMINITSLRRKVALDRNIGTVGGPIDVSIISKGDGFIWLKRKHYFDSKYNPQYLYSHYDRIERRNEDDKQ